MNDTDIAAVAVALARRYAPAVWTHDELDRPVSATAFFALAGRPNGPTTKEHLHKLKELAAIARQNAANPALMARQRQQNAWSASVLDRRIKFLERQAWIAVGVDPHELKPEVLWTKRAGLTENTLCGLHGGWATDLNGKGFGNLDRPVGYVRVQRIVGNDDAPEATARIATLAEDQGWTVYSVQYLLLFPNNDVSISHPLMAGDFSRYDHEGDWLCADFTVAAPLPKPGPPWDIPVDEWLEKQQPKFLGLILHNHGRQFMLAPGFWEGEQSHGKNINIYLEKGCHEPHPEPNPRVPTWNQGDRGRINESPPKELQKAPSLFAGERHVIHDHNATVRVPVRWQIAPSIPTGPQPNEPPSGVWVDNWDRNHADGFLLWAYPGCWGASIGDGDSPRSPFFNEKMSQRRFSLRNTQVEPGPSDAEVAMNLLAMALGLGTLAAAIGGSLGLFFGAAAMGLLLGGGLSLLAVGVALLVLQFSVGGWGGGGDGNSGRGDGRGANGHGDAVTPTDMLAPPAGAGAGKDSGWRASMDLQGLVRVFHAQHAPAKPGVVHAHQVCVDDKVKDDIVRADWIAALVTTDGENRTPRRVSLFARSAADKAAYCIDIPQWPIAGEVPKGIALKDCEPCGKIVPDCNQVAPLPALINAAMHGCDIADVGICNRSLFWRLPRANQWNKGIALPQQTVACPVAVNVPVPQIASALIKGGQLMGVLFSSRPDKSGPLFWSDRVGVVRLVALPSLSPKDDPLTDRIGVVCDRQIELGRLRVTCDEPILDNRIRTGVAGDITGAEWSPGGQRIHVRMNADAARRHGGAEDTTFSLNENGHPQFAEQRR